MSNHNYYNANYKIHADIATYDTRQSLFGMRFFSPGKRSKLCKIIVDTRKGDRVIDRFDPLFYRL